MAHAPRSSSTVIPGRASARTRNLEVLRCARAHRSSPASRAPRNGKARLARFRFKFQTADMRPHSRERKLISPPPAKRWGGVGGGGSISLLRWQRVCRGAPHPRLLPATRKGAWVEGSSRAVLACPGRILFPIHISNSGCAPAFSRHDVPELCVVVPRNKREQGMPDARCTRGLVCKAVRKKTHTSIQVQRRHSGIPCAMALRLTSRSPRRIGLCCLRRPRIAGSSAPGRADLPSADLTPTAETSGPHDFTVRFGAARPHVPRTAHEPEEPALRSHRAHDAAASTASRPNVRDDGQRPFLGDRMAGALKVICAATKEEICPSCCFVAGRHQGVNA
jgi:hypothetical protein